MYHFYNPYDPYTQAYTMYTSTTTVPTYTLQHTLMSLSNQQSRLFAQREQLAAEEEILRRLRAATLQRMRAQRLREVLEESVIEDFVEQPFERDEDEIMRDTVMYCNPCRFGAERSCREILKDERGRRMSEGLPVSSREFQREIRVREMLDPSPRGPAIQLHVQSHIPMHPQFHVHHSKHPQFQIPPAPNQNAHTPIIDELPHDFTYPSAASQYIPETPIFKNKRGSRRNSVRRDSHVTPDFIPAPPSVALDHTLQSFDQVRAKLQIELSTIPTTIRSDVPPTDELRKTLLHHMARLEDILDDVDAVVLPTESEKDTATARKVRREIVETIVGAIDGIERYIQPGTPTSGSVVGTSSHQEDSDREEDALIDQEIQRVIQETLAKKRDEEFVSRRSVTVEDVPDSEY